ncbi:MAG: phosphopyruvate hydratase [Candidatus Magasanikbacteria bacterium]|nr:phosphopyruvate hydratase [Candidatus Magasanikbacteria bacterium]
MMIKKILAREILDSRGNPTVEAAVTLENGAMGVAAVPSGASTGTHEALELRDGAKRYGGKGVLKAVKHVNTIIAPVLIGKDAVNQRGLDDLMLTLDGTPNKRKLGANAILAVSLATCRASAISLGRPLYRHIREVFALKEKEWRLPVATMNVLNGGRHADNGLSVQEFMIVPVHKQFSERVRMGSQIFHSLAAILREKGYNTAVGDEGGFAPELVNNEQALKLLVQAIQAADFIPGKHVYLAMDIAASEFYRGGKYYFASQRLAWTADKIMRVLSSWIKKYPIVSIEDPLAEDDWENWQIFTKKLGKDVIVVGDDIFVTNVSRIKRGIEEKVANAVLIKLNQIGTLSETIDAIYLARRNGYKVSVSHRSGETADTFIADLAAAVNAEFIKTGSMSRSERVEKYNRLMKIELEVNS